MYAKELQSLLFPEGSWLSKSKSHDKYVMGKSVQISQMTGKPKLRKNKVNLKIDATRRTTDKKSYDIGEFATDPEAIVFTEKMLTDPKLRAETLEAHKETIVQGVRMDIKSNWLATDAVRIVRSTGSSIAAKATGATGLRNATVYDNILDGWSILNEDKVPLKGRCMLVPVTKLPELFKIEEFIKYDFISDRNGMPIKEGVIGEILGMQVEVDMDDSPIQYDNTATPVPQALVPDDDGSANGVTFAGSVNNNLGIMMWHPDFVARAKGTTKVFIDLDNAEYQSDIMSANCIAGGDKLRKDNVGTVCIVEGFVSA